MIIVLIFILYPFYSMALSSLKTTKELYNIHVNPLWVFKPTLENYVYLFTQTNYLRWYLNSAIVALTTTPISILVSILAAYALARLEFFGSKTLGIGIFIVYLIPQTLLFIPLARVINSMGVSNTLWSLILTYPTFQIPFSTWLLMGYFRGLPKEIEDAINAKIAAIAPKTISSQIAPTNEFRSTQIPREHIAKLNHFIAHDPLHVL